ncbi:MAG: AAA family ATPase [Nitrospira sp.]|nr:AAA family ATPase [Nitrospira sp.]MDH4342100.1 AAA family ATPase [Nitrospira sp.]MDH5335247.1 AAA family ATPase [Nitrospira sp.]
MALSTSVHDLRTLIRSSHPLVVIETVEEERVLALLQSVTAQERMPLFEWSITRGLTRADESATLSKMTATPLAVLQHLHGLTVEAVFWLKDLGPHLQDPAVCRQLREVAAIYSRSRATCVLTGQPISLPMDLDKIAVRLELKLPDRDELLSMLQGLLQSLGPRTSARPRSTTLVHSMLNSISETKVADNGPTTHASDAILRALQGMTLHQARQVIAQCIVERGSLSPRDVQTILQRKVQAIKDGGLLEYYPVEDNRFELGGFTNLKSWLDRAQVGFTAEAKALNLTPPRGIMLVGVPGCGKSLAAKAIAREWKLPLLKLDAGRLFDKFVGESEKNFRKAIEMAESLSPIVLWIDEIEKAMVAGGGSGDADAGLSRRLFGAFLTWLQEKKQDVFVVATANNLSSLPPELLRKGRFDEIFFVDLPDHTERESIWKIHLGLRKQDSKTFDLSKIVSASDGFSGSEIEQAVVTALYRALHQKTPLTTDLLIEELTQTVPLSVTRREDIDALRQTAQGRFVNVR